MDITATIKDIIDEDGAAVTGAPGNVSGGIATPTVPLFKRMMVKRKDVSSEKEQESSKRR